MPAARPPDRSGLSAQSSSSGSGSSKSSWMTTLPRSIPIGRRRRVSGSSATSIATGAPSRAIVIRSPRLAALDQAREVRLRLVDVHDDRIHGVMMD